MGELRKVLLVEDEADIREVTKLSLEMVGGLRVEVCSCGEEALQKAPEFAPDLILLDVMMPGIDGPTTLQRLREHPGLRSIPVVFMTAKVMQAELDEYRSLGAADVIPKPFDPMTLTDRLKDVWRGQHGG